MYPLRDRVVNLADPGVMRYLKALLASALNLRLGQVIKLNAATDGPVPVRVGRRVMV